jgi:hypothetical protein
VAVGTQERVNDRLHLAAAEALELVADDAQLVHLEQHRAGSAPQALTPPMAPERLLALVEGMRLALDLDRHFSTVPVAVPAGPTDPTP